MTKYPMTSGMTNDEIPNDQGNAVVDLASGGLAFLLAGTRRGGESVAGITASVRVVMSRRVYYDSVE